MNIFQPMITNTAVSTDDSIFDGWNSDMIRRFTFELLFSTTTGSSSCKHTELQTVID